MVGLSKSCLDNSLILTMPTMKGKQRVALVLTLVIPVFVLTFWYALTKLNISLPDCAFKKFTSLPCLSCGLTRASEAFLQGQLIVAFWLNPLFYLLIFTVVFIWLYNLSTLFKGQPARWALKTEQWIFSPLGKVVLGVSLLSLWVYLIVNGR